MTCDSSACASAVKGKIFSAGSANDSQKGWTPKPHVKVFSRESAIREQWQNYIDGISNSAHLMNRHFCRSVCFVCSRRMNSKDKCLRPCTHLTSVGAVSFRCFLKNKGLTHRRLIGVVVLFFVFFLPLHLHFFNSTLRVGNECSCYYGARIQAGLTPALVERSPALQIFSVTTHEAQVFGWLSIKSPAVRAPPSFTSL